MRTFFICSERRIGNHAGEEYDDYIEVEDQPTTETIGDWANRIRGRIRKLWMEDEEAEKGIVVTLDTASPFVAMLINLQILMGGEEGIKVELPGIETVHTTSDPEALRVLDKLESREEVDNG